MALSIFYRQCGRVLSPSPASDESLARLGIERDAIGRWGRGVDTSRFDPALRDADAYPGEIKVLYVGRQTKEKGVELLAESFIRAHDADPRLHLLLGGGGPEEEMLRERLGDRATFLGWLDGDELPRAYASADLFLFCSRTDTFGQVLVEAGASGLPVGCRRRGWAVVDRGRRRDRAALRSGSGPAGRGDPAAGRLAGVAGEARPPGDGGGPGAHLGGRDGPARRRLRPGDRARRAAARSRLRRAA